MAEPTFQRLPGFRDFPPEDLARRSHIVDAWRRVSRRYGFLEYDGPPLEPLDLYVEKSGEEIVDQLYAFTDKGGREVALRPEMTPSLARILAERSRALPKPIRWFSVPQLFRYERQQRGRLREHFQWNVDVVGEDDVAADAEVAAVAIDGLRELGLSAEDFHCRVSDRRLLRALLLDGIGVDEARLPAAFALIDKVERMPREVAERKLGDDVGLDGDASRRLLDLLSSPGLDAVERELGGHEAVAGALAPLKAWVGALHGLGLGDFVQVDLTIVRGLAYYTGIVFELFDRKGELRAICGGGRYDRLLERVGGESLPAVGFGMGDVVLGELLADRGLLPEEGRSVDYFVVVVSEDLRERALGVARALRDQGRSVTYALRGQSVRKQFSQAGTEGARQVVVLGPDEVERGVAVVRDMASGDQREVALVSFRAEP
ncbi:MAG: histidine--tRNA ligase [Gemmatimonadetes bacterium]|nr:histidine--tRNA ligase [Gemmatimonadota bacterium]